MTSLSAFMNNDFFFNSRELSGFTENWKQVSFAVCNIPGEILAHIVLPVIVLPVGYCRLFGPDSFPVRI